MRVWRDLPKTDEIPLLMCSHGLYIGLEHIAIEFLFRLEKKTKNTFSKEEDFGSQEDELTALPCADCRSRRPHAHGRRVRPRSDAGVGGRLSVWRSGARGARAAAPSLCRLLLRTAR